MASTGKPKVAAGAGAPSASVEARAAELVRKADELVYAVLRPGRWPRRRTVERFLEGDRLERVLALYREAMVLDASEPAYPWNLASTLNRVGLHELALAFVERAIRVAQDVGDDEWADANAHLAWAEIALNARQYDVALVALARAKELDPNAPGVQGSVPRRSSRAAGVRSAIPRASSQAVSEASSTRPRSPVTRASTAPATAAAITGTSSGSRGSTSTSTSS